MGLAASARAPTTATTAGAAIPSASGLGPALLSIVELAADVRARHTASCSSTSTPRPRATSLTSLHGSTASRRRRTRSRPTSPERRPTLPRPAAGQARASRAPRSAAAGARLVASSRAAPSSPPWSLLASPAQHRSSSELVSKDDPVRIAPRSQISGLAWSARLIPQTTRLSLATPFVCTASLCTMSHSRSAG
jgi:hypothetical protein